MRRLASVAALLVLLAAPAAGAAQPSSRASVEPERPFFGDTFSYVVEVVVDARRADTVRIRADVGPFVSTEDARRTRAVSGGLARVTVTQRLACLSAACVPRNGVRSVALPPAVVSGAGPVERLAPAVVRVRPRVPDAAVQADAPEFRSPAELPEPTTRVAPGLVATLLVASGVLLLALAVAAVASPRLWRRAGDPQARGDPVARAIRLLRESVSRPTPDRRRAASLASRVVSQPGLADDAARTAWSREAPDESAATGLADRIDRARSTAP